MLNCVDCNQKNCNNYMIDSNKTCENYYRRPDATPQQRIKGDLSRHK